MNERDAWRLLLALAKGRGTDVVRHAARGFMTPQDAGLFRHDAGVDDGARLLLDQYLPLCRACPARFVVAHLGQSLDGRIAAVNGASRWVTGSEDLVHNHRMRALFDAVVVGAGTIRHDDPQLTVREVPGANPVRVVLDARRTLGSHYGVFSDGEAPTLLMCDGALAGPGERFGQAEVVGLAGPKGGFGPEDVLDRLAERGLTRVFVEGGGVTVSRFLAAGTLHRLQITVAPLILGSGRPSISLPEIERLSAGLRPPVRRFDLGEDVLFECHLDD